MLFLCCLLMGILGINFGMDLFRKQSVTDFTSVKKALAEWESHQNNRVHSSGDTLFPFNPNTISEEALDSLSIPWKVKQNLMEYRRSGGWFPDSHSVRKIYGMNDSLFALLKDYMVFPREQKGSERTNKTTLELSVDAFFDPNSVSGKQLMEWGLPVFQATNLIKYRENGGVFKTAEDVMKIYGLDSTLFRVLKPWIRIEKKESSAKKRKEPANPVYIELNRADSADLITLYGIGPVFSSRIIRYRELLGGFIDTQQLLEVYNFEPERYAQIKDRIWVDTSGIKKISLNFSDYHELVSHPYLRRHHAEKIISTRNKSGPFETCEELFSKNILDEEVYKKIRPYLKLN